MSTESATPEFDPEAIIAFLKGTWWFINEPDGIGLIHFTDTGRAIQFVSYSDQRVPMRLWYSVESTSHLRFRYCPDQEGWLRGYVFDGSAWTMSAENKSWVCKRPSPEQIPEWFDPALTSALAEHFAIREATEQDAAAIAELAGELGYPAPPETMQERIKTIAASSTDVLFVAIGPKREKLAWLQVHCCHLIESGFRAEIVGLVVSRNARRIGLGRALVARAERWAANLGAKAIVVRSNIKRAEAHEFYPALGYTAAKTQHVYRKELSRPSSEGS